MQASAKSGDQISQRRYKVGCWFGVIAASFFITGLTIKQTWSDESSVSPAQDEMRIVRDQLQRQKTEGQPDTMAPREPHGLHNRPAHSGENHGRTDQESEPTKP